MMVILRLATAGPNLKSVSNFTVEIPVELGQFEKVKPSRKTKLDNAILNRCSDMFKVNMQYT